MRSIDDGRLPLPRQEDQRLAAALLHWYDTTHGNELGHDHHCPDSAREHRKGTTGECSCGWDAVVEAEATRYP
jgi:hypothetical protein